MQVSLHINITIFLGTKFTSFWHKLHILSIRKASELQETKVNMLNQAAHLCPHAPGILIAQIRNIAKHITATFCPSRCLSKGEGSWANGIWCFSYYKVETQPGERFQSWSQCQGVLAQPMHTALQTCANVTADLKEHTVSTDTTSSCLEISRKFFPMTLGFCFYFMGMFWMIR